MLAWADGLDPAEVGITAMNEAEILHGMARLPEGRRKQALLESWRVLVPALLGDRGHHPFPGSPTGHPQRG